MINESRLSVLRHFAAQGISFHSKKRENGQKTAEKEAPSERLH